MSTRANRLPTGPPPVCRRCADCAGQEHHWVDDFEGPTEYSCKHCPAIAVQCVRCGGSGEVEVFGGATACGRCNGNGIIEVVEITLAQVEVLRRDQARLRCIEQIGLIETGESTTEMVDQMVAMMIARGRRKNPRATSPGAERNEASAITVEESLPEGDVDV